MSWIRSVTKKTKKKRWIENLALREAMQRLNSREKHIIELRFYEGKTQMEVAEQINISQAQVKPSGEEML